MSHFSQIKTQLRNLPTLKETLSDLKGWIMQEGPQCGYKGTLRPRTSVIEQEKWLWFVWNGVSHEIVTDLQFWNQASSVDRFLK
jgi:hypothetical protein